jgi:hypothetical protein
MNKPFVIIREGIRIGFFENREDAIAALKYCSEGYVVEDR